MAEAVGVVASVATLAAAINKLSHYASRYKSASLKLREYLRHLEGVMFVRSCSNEHM